MNARALKAARHRLLNEYAKLAARTDAKNPCVDTLKADDWKRLHEDPRVETMRDKSASVWDPDGKLQLVLFGGRVIVRRA